VVFALTSDDPQLLESGFSSKYLAFEGRLANHSVKIVRDHPLGPRATWQRRGA
jgi:hypothetical protein